MVVDIETSRYKSKRRRAKIKLVERVLVVKVPYIIERRGTHYDAADAAEQEEDGVAVDCGTSPVVAISRDTPLVRVLSDADKGAGLAVQGVRSRHPGTEGYRRSARADIWYPEAGEDTCTCSGHI